MCILRLILMQVQFRPLYFSEVAKNKSPFFLFVQNAAGFLLFEIGRGDGTWAICCLLVRLFISSVRFLGIENSSQRRLLLCLAPRRVHFARPWTQASKPALTDSNLAAKRRAEALHLVFFQPSNQAHHDDLHIAAAVCVLV